MVGTGMEGKVARDSRALIVSDVDGVVERVSADMIVVREEIQGDDSEVSRKCSGGVHALERI